MKIIRFDNIVDIGDTVYIYRNRSRDFEISPKEMYCYSSYDPFVVKEIFPKVKKEYKEKSITQKYAKIKDEKTNRVFEIPYSSLSMKPNDVNITDRVIQSIILFFIGLITYSLYRL